MLDDQMYSLNTYEAAQVAVFGIGKTFNWHSIFSEQTATGRA
jgi:hypothetical protein